MDDLKSGLIETWEGHVSLEKLVEVELCNSLP
jgi:hypothetical protein